MRTVPCIDAVRGMTMATAVGVALLIASPSCAADLVAVFGEAYASGSTTGPAVPVGFNTGALADPEVSRSVTFNAVGFPYGNPLSATASASADLTSGEVGAYVSASEGSRGRAIASWAARVTIVNPNVGATDTWGLQFELSHHGAFTALGDTVPGGFPNASSLMRFNVSGQPILGFQQGGEFVVSRGSNFAGSQGGSGVTLLNARAGQPNETIFTLGRTVYGNNVVIALSLLLDAGAQDGYVADFGNTAGFSFNLPTGATFSSDSGAFLSAVGGVPEPAAWALMISGFGLAGAALRRRTAIV